MNFPRLICLSMLMAAAVLSVGCVTDTPDLPTTAEQEFKPLFNGKDLDGWEVVGGDAAFSVVDGEIVGVCKNTTKNTFLRTKKRYDDFEFRCQFKWDTPGNSGIQYRSHQRPSSDEREPGRVYGYQFELDSSARAWSGGLYEEGRRGWIINLEGDDEQNTQKRAAVKLDDWNDVVIECKGNRIRTWLNGVNIVNYKDEDPGWALTEGFFALQVHSGGSGQFRWRNLRIKELEVK